MNDRDRWSHIKVFNDQDGNLSRSSWEASGFADEEEAKTYTQWILDRIGWGYSPSGKVVKCNKKWIVQMSMWNSCD